MTDTECLIGSCHFRTCHTRRTEHAVAVLKKHARSLLRSDAQDDRNEGAPSGARLASISPRAALGACWRARTLARRGPTHAPGARSRPRSGAPRAQPRVAAPVCDLREVAVPPGGRRPQASSLVLRHAPWVGTVVGCGPARAAAAVRLHTRSTDHARWLQAERAARNGLWRGAAAAAWAAGCVRVPAWREPAAGRALRACDTHPPLHAASRMCSQAAGGRRPGVLRRAPSSRVC